MTDYKLLKSLKIMVLQGGIEPPTSPLPRRRSMLEHNDLFGIFVVYNIRL